MKGSGGNERVAALGGTWLLGRRVMSGTYRVTDPVVRALVALRVSPNAVSWASLALGLAAGGAIAIGWFAAAFLLVGGSALADLLDGQVARAIGVGSNRGELLDAAIDRYTEAALFGGFALAFHEVGWQVALALGAQLGATMVTYATAKAEAMRVRVPSGLMRRHERATYVLVGIGLSAIVDDPLPSIVALAIVALAANVAAIVRLARISKALI